MEIILYILYVLLSLAAIFVIVLVGMFFYVGYRVLSGKMTKEEQDFHLRQYEKMKKERKAKKSSSSILIDSDPDVAWSLGEDTLF